MFRTLFHTLFLATLATAAALRAGPLVRAPRLSSPLSSSRAAVFAAASDSDQVLYAVGLSVARSLGELTTLLEKDELRVVGGAIADALIGEPRADFDMGKYMPQVEGLLTARQEKAGEASVSAGLAVLEKAAAVAGAVKTDSGLVYLETAAGTGASPTGADKVTAHYTGTLPDGTVFDSSVTRGEPLTFPLGGVIKGWQEGLAMMQEGGKATLTIPSDLGYGDQGTGPIPAKATLTFDVELIKVEAAEVAV